MRILGVDPGLARLGYGLVVKQGGSLVAERYGLVETAPSPLPERLYKLHKEFETLIAELNPDAIATERLLFTVNKTTAMDVAKALGVVLLATSEKGIAWAEYSPPEVKQSVVGNGSADKRQVQFMVTRLLSLKDTPKPDDVADALAIAITHALRSTIPTLPK